MNIIQNGNVLKLTAFLIPVLLIILFIFFKINNLSLCDFLISEDSAVEYVQAVSYAIAEITLILSSIREKRNRLSIISVFLCLSGLVLMFVSLEEIS